MENDLTQLNARPASLQRAALALLMLVPAPSIGVLFAMHLMPDTAIGKTMHLSAKVWLFAFPLIWLMFVERIKLSMPRWSWDGMGAGFITGGLILAIITGGWELVGKNLVDVAVFKEGMDKVGLDTPLKFLGFAAAVSFINALLEEYVWRWFVYSKWFELLKSLKLPAKSIAPVWIQAGAIGLAGVCFVIHHSIAMSVYFPWSANALASLGIFIGGVTWSILYLKYKNIYAAYVSHILADIALFYVGYRIAFG
ncbi:MAG: CPBP family intramembrane glutamic endopeptidase [Planctomycetota bacterium]